MIQVDCADPERLASFWGAVLGVEIDQRLGEGPQYVSLTPSDGPVPPLWFQRVPEPKVVKNRIHLDLLVDDIDAACRRVEALGGGRRDSHDFRGFHGDAEPGFDWRRMTDLAGNEFCLVYRVQSERR
jgi:hypothetical protein